MNRGAAALLLVAFSVRAQAQGSYARMSGTVTMPDGTPVGGVTVKLETATEEGVNAEAESNAKGRYLIGMVRHGSYLLRVETHGELVLTRVKGKGLDTDAGNSVLWEIDTAASSDQPPKINVGSRNQLTLDIVVGPKAMAAKAPGEQAAEQKAIEDAFAAGLARVRDGDFKGALELLEPLAQKAPEHANTWYLIGFSRERLGQLDTALSAADRATSLDPALAGVHVLRGRILRGQKRLPEAEAEIRQEIEHAGSSSVVFDSWVALASVLEDAGRSSEAIQALEHAVELDPARGEVSVELARLYTTAGDRDKAAAALERAEQAGKGDDARVLNLAIGALNDNQYDRAEDIARRVVDKGSSNANLSVGHSVLARCDLHRGNYPGAVTHLEQALALDPNSSLAAENRDILAAAKKR
jgi:tetratricopeptide (TPR) repeat protein